MGEQNMGKVWQTAGVARREFAEMIEGLDESQLEAETWCTGWTPKHVLGHLTWLAGAPLPAFFLEIIVNKFDFDAASMSAAKKAVQQQSVEEMVKSLKERATAPAKVPTFPEGLTVTDVAVHTLDVRWALGLDGELDKTVLEDSLRFLTSDAKAQKVLGAPNLDGLVFEATDTGFAAGSGKRVSGTGGAIITAIMGRPTLEKLEGDGVAELRSRL